MANRRAWKNIFLFQVYEMIKTGMFETKVAETINITPPTWRAWKQKKPLFALAISEGKKLCKKKDDDLFSFSDFVAGRLSEEVRETWDKINRCDTLKNGVERVEAILSERGLRVRQQLFVQAWVTGNFSTSNALRKVNISYSAFDLWKKDPEFLRLLEELSEIKGDFFEEYFCRLVAAGNPQATIVANQTYNRKRGYGNPTKIELDMNVQGTLQHNIIPIEILNKCSLETRKELLKVIREEMSL